MSKGSGASARGGGGGGAALESLGDTEVSAPDVESGDASAISRSTKFQSGLSKAEAKAIDYYTGEGYSEIRKAMTGEKTSNRAVRDAALIQGALKREKKGPETDVFRGMAVNEKDLKRIMRTKNISLNSITSTTRDPAMAAYYVKSNSSKSNEYGVVLKIRQKSGVSIDTLSSIGIGEREVLMRSGTKLRVDRMQKTTIQHGNRAIKTLVIHAREV